MSGDLPCHLYIYLLDVMRKELPSKINESEDAHGNKLIKVPTQQLGLSCSRSLAWQANRLL